MGGRRVSGQTRSPLVGTKRLGNVQDKKDESYEKKFEKYTDQERVVSQETNLKWKSMEWWDGFHEGLNSG